MALSKRLRFEILRRDNHACRYCGASAPEVTLTIDHVVPVALGGTDEPTNLVAACAGCNGGKAASSPDAPVVADVAADALRWSAAMQEAASVALADLGRRNSARGEFAAKWNDWTAGGKPFPLPAGWENTVDHFIAAGLPMDLLHDCVDIAMGKRHVRSDQIFRYMCGIGWKRVTDLQEAARSAVQEPAIAASASAKPPGWQPEQLLAVVITLLDRIVEQISEDTELSDAVYWALDGAIHGGNLGIGEAAQLNLEGDDARNLMLTRAQEHSAQWEEKIKERATELGLRAESPAMTEPEGCAF